MVLATKGTVGESNTAWAQGGVAAALDLEEDSAFAHFTDTLAAGAGLCDERAAAVVAAEAPERVEELRRMGVPFDLTVGGGLELTREAAHSRARVAHSADATGHAIATTLIARTLRHPHVTLLERATAMQLRVDGGVCRGALLLSDGAPLIVSARSATVLATGGCGRIFARTTNPPAATGDGLSLALRVGARLADLEFVQFHPTALALEGAPAMLVSEAARGEGAILTDLCGRRFCFDEDPRGELAPRDVVARAIWHELQKRSSHHVLLDMRPIGSPDMVRMRFPNIAEACARYGIDIGDAPIPVSPAAHYHMGGIVSDLWGRTSVPSLYALGECACTGLHGANRLASNSLAECLVFASRAAEDIGAMQSPPEKSTSLAGYHPSDAIFAPEHRHAIADTMWQAAGVERDGPSLTTAASSLSNWPTPGAPLASESLEGHALLTAARLIAESALLREESRGSHFRRDFPKRDDSRWQQRIVWDSKGHSLQPIAGLRER